MNRLALQLRMIGLAGLMLTASACTEATPQSACSSAMAREPLKKIVLDSTTLSHPERRKLAEQGQMSLDQAVVQEHDQATGNMACSAIMTYTLPKEAMTDGGRELKSGIVYIARPSADGDGWVYTSPGIQLSWVVTYLGTLRYADGHAFSALPRPASAGPPGEPAAQPDFYTETLEPLADGATPRSTAPGRNKPFTADEEKLIDEFNQATADCRMDDGPDPELSCKESDVLLAALQLQGICWGRDGEARADHRAHRCGPGSIR